MSFAGFLLRKKHFFLICFMIIFGIISITAIVLVRIICIITTTMCILTFIW